MRNRKVLSNLIYNVYKKPIANIILHGDKHEAFLQK